MRDASEPFSKTRAGNSNLDKQTAGGGPNDSEKVLKSLREITGAMTVKGLESLKLLKNDSE